MMDKERKLKTLLDGLDVPENRKRDYGWLLRNLLVRNKEDNADRALKLVKEILKEPPCCPGGKEDRHRTSRRDI